MKAHEILNNAAGHLADRASTYDKPEGERSMQAAVDAMRAVSGVSMTAEQGWLFMALLKAVRTQQGGYRADNYEDGAAYFALAGEQAAVDRGGDDGMDWPDPFPDKHLDIDDQCAEAIHAEPSGEDMTDPANWRAGDLVRCIYAATSFFQLGGIYPIIISKVSGKLSIDHGGDIPQEISGAQSKFRFHSRPSK